MYDINKSNIKKMYFVKNIFIGVIVLKPQQLMIFYEKKKSLRDNNEKYPIIVRKNILDSKK